MEFELDCKPAPITHPHEIGDTAYDGNLVVHLESLIFEVPSHRLPEVLLQESLHDGAGYGTRCIKADGATLITNPDLRAADG